MTKRLTTEQEQDLASELIDKIGDIIDDTPMNVVHMAISRLYAIVSVESGCNKDQYMSVCNLIWDLVSDENTEETIH